MLALDKHNDMLNIWIGEHCTVDALNVRLQAERDAIAFLQEHRGILNQDELLHFCSLWNAECFDRAGIPRVITCSRFGDDYTILMQGIEKNSTQYIIYVEEIWNALHGFTLDEIFALYSKYMNNEGIYLLFSMLLYLYSIQSKQKQALYPWTVSMTKGMAYLFDATNPQDCANYIVGITPPLEEKLRIASKLNYAEYIMHCEHCHTIRNHCNVYPQEVDFLLHMAAKI